MRAVQRRGRGARTIHLRGRSHLLLANVRNGDHRVVVMESRFLSNTLVLTTFTLCFQFQPLALKANSNVVVRRLQVQVSVLQFLELLAHAAEFFDLRNETNNHNVQPTAQHANTYMRLQGQT